MRQDKSIQICKLNGYKNILPYYYITPSGKIYSGDGEVIQRTNSFSDHPFVRLGTRSTRKSKSGVVSIVRRKVFVHRLVASAFRSKYRKTHYEVHHKDSNPKNNNVKNLLWVSHEEHRAIHKRAH